MSYPRVMHVGFHPIGAPTNSGLTLGSMFGGWPEDRLLQVCSREHPDVAGTSNLVLTPPSVAPVDGFVRSILGKRLPSGSVDGLNNSVSRPSAQLTVKKRLRLAATAANDIGPVWLPPSVVQRVREFRPEVVHSLLGGVRAMRLATRLSRQFDIPLVPHFMDDWVDNLFAHGQLGGFARRQVDRALDDALERAPLCLTIGEDMRREYEERLRRPCVVVGNSVDLGAYQELLRNSGDRITPRSMRYVGGLHLGRADVLRTLARALESRQPIGAPWALELFVPASDASLGSSLEKELGPVRFGGSLAPGRVPEVLASADALLFLESAEPHISSFTRLSVSTKVPQYLASGRPILVVGPDDQASVNELMRSGAGAFGGGGGDITRMCRAIDELERSPRRAGPVSPEQVAWVAERFGLEPTRRRLREALSSAALSRPYEPGPRGR